jgi:hypothetical protein
MVTREGRYRYVLPAAAAAAVAVVVVVTIVDRQMPVELLIARRDSAVVVAGLGEGDDSLRITHRFVA